MTGYQPIVIPFNYPGIDTIQKHTNDNMLCIQLLYVLAVANMFLYGRGTENRTLIYGLKARYFAIKLYPQHLITLVTGHDRSPFNIFSTLDTTRTL